jgi:hypothetical protein
MLNSTVTLRHQLARSPFSIFQFPFSNPLAFGYKLSASSPTSLFALISNFRASSFQALAHSFVFRITVNHCRSNNFRTLRSKTGGYTPAWSDHGASLPAVGSQCSFISPLLSSFATSLTQKQGGMGTGHTREERDGRPYREERTHPLLTTQRVGHPGARLRGGSSWLG